MNKKIKKRPGLNEQYCISQGQFANIPGGIDNNKTEDAEIKAGKYIEQVWNLRLRSLLYEYVRGEGKEEEFVESCSYKEYKEYKELSEKSSDNKDQSSGEQNND